MRVLFFLWAVQAFAAFNLTWGIPAINLDSNPPIGDTDANATAAIDPSGNAIATWGRTVGAGASEDILASLYNHSSRTWSGPFKISGGGSAVNSQVAMDTAGNAIIVWEEGFPTQIMFRTLSSAGVWHPPLESPPNFIQESLTAQTAPQIAIDSKGNALAIWAEFVEEHHQIYAARKPFRLPWQDSQRISSRKKDATTHLTHPLVMNEAGDAVAVWQETNGNAEIHAAQFIKGIWQPAIAIGEGESPSVAIDRNGNSVFVWSHANIIQSKSLIEGTLSAPLTASNPAYIAQRPDVGVDLDGNAVVVFERCDAMSKFISGATLPFRETSWSMPTDISGPSSLSSSGAGYPILSLNPIGDGVVVWKEFYETHIVIQGAGYSLGTWSATRTLSRLDDNAGAPTPSYDIGLAVNLAGNIVALWPEDPSGKGTQQIKATIGVGLANPGPLPPVPIDLVPIATLPPAPTTTLPPVSTDPTPIAALPPAPINPTPIAALPPKAGPVSENSGGAQVYHRFPAHGDLINILNWSSPGGVAYYRIYRGSFSNLIGTSATTRYEDHQRIPKRKEMYLITSVDSYEQESAPITIFVRPLH